jgi:hypothetical protein
VNDFLGLVEIARYAKEVGPGVFDAEVSVDAAIEVIERFTLQKGDNRYGVALIGLKHLGILDDHLKLFVG